MNSRNTACSAIWCRTEELLVKKRVDGRGDNLLNSSDNRQVEVVSRRKSVVVVSPLRRLVFIIY